MRSFFHNKALDLLYKEINECTKCHLSKNRQAVYKYRGDPSSRIVLIGEALGEKEQETGFPFVGRSGKLLDRLLKQAGVNPETDVYITNLVKDRPPNNRNPFYDEIKECQHHLLIELKIIRPNLIVTLGKVAGNWFANGREYDINKHYKERRWLPLYHPSYLLRNIKEREKFVNTVGEIITKETSNGR